MKVDLGSLLALYPMPLGVIGAKVANKNTFTLVANYGIVSHSHILVSLAKSHYINKGIKEKKSLTINFVDMDMLKKADYCGSVSRNKVDKERVFNASVGKSGAPIIDESPLALDCVVDNVYEIDGFENFICKIVSTYVDEKYLTENKKSIDYRKLKPVLFEFPTYEYLSTGEVIGKCLSFSKEDKKMKYVKLGNSDLNVSRICLGCMGFGDASGMQNWALNYEESEKIIKHALDLGINFFDTANCYSNGTSEIFLGRALKKYAKREDVIIATKVYFNEGKLSKEAIHREVKKSLERLGTNYIDLLIIHRFDYDTPIKETMEALNEEIKMGYVRYIGASAMYAYQFAKMQDCARENGFHTFISMQDHYNLIYREEEREMLKLLKEEGVSSTPYSPLAGGRLSRLWSADTKRSQIDSYAAKKYDDNKDEDMPIVKRVYDLAQVYKCSQSQIALSWLLSKEPVASVLLGATKEKYIDEAVKALDLTLTEENKKYLEELYKPHKVVGALDRNQGL